MNFLIKNEDEKDLLSMLVFITTMPISILSPDGTITQTEGGWSKDVLPLEQDKLLVQTILKEYKNRKSFVINDIFSIFFAVAPWFDNKICVLGPFSDAPISSGSIRAFAIKHNIQPKPISNYLLSQMHALLKLINFIVCGKMSKITPQTLDFVSADKLQKDINDRVLDVFMHHMEVLTPHNDGSWEIIRRKSIMNGDLNSLEHHLNAPFSGKRGVIAKDSLRNIKNLAIVDVTVSSRAALDAGLDSETVYSISDGYILKIEEVVKPEQAEVIANIAAREFTHLVSELKNNKVLKLNAQSSEAFIKAYNYIKRNYNLKLSVKSIAHEANASVTYLQNQFKKNLNSNIHDFLNKVRVENSLIFLGQRQYSICDIALMVGFCNSSHFIKEFKKIKNETPSKYRLKLLNNYILDTNIN